MNPAAQPDRLEFVDSTGVSALLAGAEQAAARGQRFVLRNPGRLVLKVLRLIRAELLLDIESA